MFTPSLSRQLSGGGAAVSLGPGSEFGRQSPLSKITLGTGLSGYGGLSVKRAGRQGSGK